MQIKKIIKIIIINLLDLIEKNGLIIVDNVLWHGEVVEIKKQ